jgi:arylsulfatase A-like enzyme
MDCQYRSRALSLTAVDYWVGRLLDRIEQAGELDETFVMFVSDNGYMQGQHRIPTGKVIPYEESIRVPLILRAPTLPEGVVREQLVANIDWAPTILDAAGVQPGDPSAGVQPGDPVLDGISLLPLARDPRAGRGRDILLEASDFEPFPGNRSPAYEGIRAQRWTYVEYKTGERELYDLAADPAQLDNLDHSRTHGTTRKRLATALDRLRKCAGESCREGLIPAE